MGLVREAAVEKLAGVGGILADALAG